MSQAGGGPQRRHLHPRSPAPSAGPGKEAPRTRVADYCATSRFILWWFIRGKGVRVTRLLGANDRSGKVKLAALIWIIAIGIVAYCGIQVGGVYMRKYKLKEAVDRELGLAGQIVDETIRQRLTEDIAGMHLPPAASRFRFARVQGPRALQFSVSYDETVNLIFTEKPFHVSINARRPF
jgi:hypothetical protein